MRLPLTEGQIIRFDRTFTKEDVEKFTKLSLDEGDHHVIPDEHGRLIVQGLLTATLPTKIGGDYNIIGKTMYFEFLRPVFTGDTITCTVTIEQCEKIANNRTELTASFICTNQNEKQVMKGKITGILLP